ncbi:MAG: cysteine desulfurase family protein, partial [Actinomycetota bacterium]|nr:cysteine desulfurase family protein [Actinomycetota bacterium]
MLYLDHAATTPMRPEARDAMLPFLGERFGNPSGVHGASRQAKDAIEASRERAAALIGAAHPLEIVFTGGGTEADNLAVTGTALAATAGGSVVTTAIEHPAVLEPARFVERLGSRVTLVGVGNDGRVLPETIAAAVDDRTAVVSVMAANNETGVVQPVAGTARAVRSRVPDVVIHSDAVQAFNSQEVTVGNLDVDLLSLSAHKFGGPQGVGLVYVRDGLKVEPVLHGGEQELGRRSGTHNVAGIVGMVAAMEAAVADRGDFRNRIEAARDGFENELRTRIPGVSITASGSPRVASHSHVCFAGVDAETLLVRLDQA